MRYFLPLFLLIMVALILVGCGEKIKKEGQAAIEQATGLDALTKKIEADKNIAVIRAKAVYNQKLSQGVNMESGPCLTNELMPGWVVDVAHNPRESIDDLEKNKCSDYASGIARHFVELDITGNLIRAE